VHLLFSSSSLKGCKHILRVKRNTDAMHNSRNNVTIMAFIDKLVGRSKCIYIDINMYVCVFVCVILEISVLKDSFIYLSAINRKESGLTYNSRTCLCRAKHRRGTVSGMNQAFTCICPNGSSKKERSDINRICCLR
jgi:hypothetical protein